MQSVKDQFVAQFVSILKFGRRSPFELLGQLKGGGDFPITNSPRKTNQLGCRQEASSDSAAGFVGVVSDLIYLLEYPCVDMLALDCEELPPWDTLHGCVVGSLFWSWGPVFPILQDCYYGVRWASRDFGG